MNISKTLHTEKDFLNLSQNINRSSLVSPGYIRTQMAVTHCLSALPEKFISTVGIDKNYPIDKAWGFLSVIDKISVFIRAKGIKSTATFFPSWQNFARAEFNNAQTADEWVKTLKKYKKEVVVITNGALASSTLSYYDVLQTQIFYEIKCLGEVEGNIVSQSLMIVKEHIIPISTEEGLKNMYELCMIAFTFITKSLSEDTLPDYKHVLSILETVKNYFLSYARNYSDKSIHRRLYERAQHLLVMLDLIQKACTSPLSLMPILSAPLQTQAKDWGYEGNDQRRHLAPEATEWLDQFLSICKYHSNYFFTQISKTKEITKQSQAIQASFNKFWSETDESNKKLVQLLKNMHQIQLMSEQKYLEQMKELKKMTPSILAFFPRIEEALDVHDKLVNRISGLTLPNLLEKTSSQLFVTPYRYYHDLAISVLTSLYTKQVSMLKLLKSLYTQAEGIFKEIQSPYLNTIYYLDYQFRDLCFTLIMDQNNDVNLKISEIYNYAIEFSSVLHTTPTQLLSMKARTKSMGYAKQANQALKAIDSLMEEKSNTAKKTSLATLKILFDFFSELFLLDNWPLLITQNKQDLKIDKNKEKLFLLNQFLVICRSIQIVRLEQTKNQYLELLNDYGLLKIEGLSAKILPELDKIFQVYNELQQSLPTELSSSNFIEKGLIFYNKLLDMTLRFEIHVHNFFEILENCSNNALNPSLETKEPIKILKYFFEAWDRITTFPLKGIIHYLRSHELLIDLEKKSLPSPKNTKLPPVAKFQKIVQPKGKIPIEAEQILKQKPPSVIVTPKTSEEFCVELWNINQILAHLYQGLSNVKKEKAAIDHFSPALLNIQHSMAVLQEMIPIVETNGYRPYFVWDLQLRISVLLEQTAVAIFALLDLTPAEWVHDPLQLFESLEGLVKDTEIKAALNFTKEERLFLGKLSSVIPISSRYLYSGRNDLSRKIETLNNIQNQQRPEILVTLNSRLSKDTDQFALMGLSIAFKLLKTLIKDPQASPQAFENSIETASIILSKLSNVHSSAHQNISSSLQTMLKDIQLTRIFSKHRSISLVSPLENSVMQRSKTIAFSLKDLSMLIDLMKDAMSTPFDPSVALTMTHTALKLEATALELVLLVMLAYLPVKSVKKHCHYLFSEEPFLRHSHRLEDFAMTLRAALEEMQIDCPQKLIENTLERAQILTPYVKTLYRYSHLPNGQAVESTLTLHLSEAKALSSIWSDFIQGNFSQSELVKLDDILKNSNSSKEASLESSIINFIDNHYAQLVNTMTLVKDWLKIFHEILRKS